MAYLALDDYGLIGNHSSVALVSRLGSIDWCCFPSIDSPSHFGAILDENRGGKFSIAPTGDFRSEQRYIQRTHVLETLFETPYGRAVLTDWMPMDSSESDRAVIYRRVEVITGKITWTLQCSPRFQYGKAQATAENHRDGLLFRDPDSEATAALFATVPLATSGPTGQAAGRGGTSATAKFTLEAGQSASFSWGWGAKQYALPAVPKVTIEHWKTWAHHCVPEGCGLAGPWHDATVRSALVLRLLMNADIGSVAEAATTSIPGVAGESRTWDYRFAWIRIGAAMIQAFANMGYREECHSFFNWLADLVARDGAEGLQPVYRLDGGKLLPEHELDFLSGYQGSKPVRIGNQSSVAFQLDLYGHVMLAAVEYHKIYGETSPQLWDRLWPRLAQLADYVCQAWRRPDHGFWEVRSKPEHFTASKLFAWAALDRAIWLGHALRKNTPPRWSQEREILHNLICTQGYDAEEGTFVRAFGETELDSATLFIPILGFLPPDDPRVMGTLNAIESRLANGVLFDRYQGNDGLDGKDANHLMTSFWFVSCLALTGRVDEASDRLAELCTYANPLGLYGEQAALATGETSGNFPSASVHAGLINAALYVGAARGRQVLTGHLMGLSNPSAPLSYRKTG